MTTPRCCLDKLALTLKGKLVETNPIGCLRLAPSTIKIKWAICSSCWDSNPGSMIRYFL